MMKALWGFHHRIARRISCRCPKQRQDRTWWYPRIKDARRVAGLLTIEHYVAVRQQTFVDKVATHPIYALCEASVRRTGSATSMYWWSQPKLDTDAVPQIDVGIGQVPAAA
jgi:hypothetical protein